MRSQQLYEANLNRLTERERELDHREQMLEELLRQKDQNATSLQKSFEQEQEAVSHLSA